MLRNIYTRFMATIGSITEETINEWHRQNSENYRHYNARLGEVIESNENKIIKIRKKLIQDYEKEVDNVWKNEKRNIEGYQKMRFANEYAKLKKHWETVSFLYRGNKDYLGYGKMPGFEDTPDDLLDKMKGAHHRGFALKALEHSARRVGLINPDCKNKKILQKRKDGIPASGFSRATLYKYLEEGNKVIEYLDNLEKQKSLSEQKELTD